MLSKSAVRKAGSVMRRQAEGKASQEEVEQALAVVSAFRASFAGPLEAASGELATLLETHQIQGEVSQRGLFTGLADSSICAGQSTFDGCCE